MKTSIYISSVVWLTLTILLFQGCTKDFQELNTNPSGANQEQRDGDYLYVSSLLAVAQRAVICQDVGDYQLAQNLSSDSYSGYMGAEAPFRSNSNNLTYDLVDGWNVSIWNYRYKNIMNPTYKVIEEAKKVPAYKDLDALARIIRVSAMARVSDKIGPIIYSKYNTIENGGISYDAQKDVYPLFFADLDIAMNTLKSLQTATISSQMQKSDLAYTTNNYVNWLKYTNTLRLRLALRIAFINPALAKTQGEIALNPANGGLLDDNSQNCYVALSVKHPLNIIVNDWSDTRMGAPMESILGGYNDPRMPAYFEPASDPAVTGQYKGIRTGINIDDKSRYDSYSKLDVVENKMQLMVAAESWFLKAEAALRGWVNAGDAQTNYETGIDRSFAMYGLGAATAYKNNAVSVPKAYIDPKAITAGENNVAVGSPYLSTITIKWNAADNNNRKLERIITQKWIAIFPDGEEAWAEYRRTGYPILFPVIKNSSAGAIPTLAAGSVLPTSQNGVRRIPIPQIEYSTNSAAAKTAVATLGGPDNGATRLWWDVANKSL